LRKCLKCKHENHESHRFCVQCGKKLEEPKPGKLLFCQCGERVNEGDIFCGLCEINFAENPPTEEPAIRPDTNGI